MKPFSIVAILTVPLVLSLIAVSCVFPQLSGNSSEVDNKTICGIIFEPDGKTRARGASVFIRSRDYLSDASSLSKRKTVDPLVVESTCTNDTGYYRFDSLQEGMYCIEGRDGGNNCVLIDSIAIADDKKHQPLSDTLKPAGSIRGTIPWHDNEMTAYVRVFGLDVIRKADSSGVFSIENLPEGKLRVLITFSWPGRNAFDTLAVVTKPDSASFIDSLISANSRYAGERYLLTVVGSGSGKATGSDSVVHGIPHAIIATHDSGYHFSVWRVTSGNATLADSFAAKTTVILKEGDARVEGVFKVGITFQKTFGGTLDDVGNSVQQTSDGGYIIAGSTSSFGAGDSDVYLIKTDAAGNESWTKTFGGDSNDVGNSVQQTSDGGFIIAGSTRSFGSGASDAYLVKTDAAGNALWTKTFGDTADEFGNFVQQASDGGYIFVGSIGNSAVYLIKTDAAGNESWEKTFSDGATNIGSSVQQTNDGGYIIAEYYFTAGASIKLIKTDAAGNESWTQNLGGGSCRLVRQTIDGGYALFGYEGGRYGQLSCLLKTDAAGNEIWRKTFSNVDGIYSGQQTDDGGFIVVGSASSYNAGKFSYSSKVSLIKTDAAGNATWEKTFGAAGDNVGYSVRQTGDGGYIFAGYTGSSGAGGTDVYLNKTDENGNTD